MRHRTNGLPVFYLAVIGLVVLLATTTANAETQVTVASGMLSQFDLQVQDLANLVDGNTSSNAFHTDSADPNAWMKIDLGAGNEKALIKWEYYASLATLPATWDIQFSDDDSSWIDTFTGLSMNGGIGWHSATWPSAGSHRYWRSLKTDAASGGGWHTELGVFVPEPSTVTLAALGLVGLAAFGWRRRKR